jgi:hypothetical protein
MAMPVVRRTPSEEKLPPVQRLAMGAYVTDGSNLFRCISVDDSRHPDAAALLEDCLSLEVLILPATEVAAADLRVVRPAPSDRADTHPAEPKARA